MEDLERQLHDAEQVARMHEEAGRTAEAADLRAGCEQALAFARHTDATARSRQ